jgi:hypothetical protein
MVWGGAGLALLGFAWLLVGDAARQGSWAWINRPAVAETMTVCGALVLAYGLHRRAGDASRRLAARNYSWCAACQYPFDETTPDCAMVTCSECGANFRADLSREWYRVRPERLRGDRNN